MALGAILETLGVGGSIETAITGALALYHGRSLLGVAARLSTWLRIAGVLGFVVFLAELGLIPGVELSMSIGALSGAIGGVVDAVPTPSLPKVLP